MTVEEFKALPLPQQVVIRDRAKKVLSQAQSRKREALAALEALQAEIERRRVKAETEDLLRDFKHFVYAAWHLVEPDQKLLWNWHLDELSDVVALVYEGFLPQVIANIPPGMMKSLLFSVFARAWYWAKNPALRFLAGSYGAHLSTRDNVKLRLIVTSEWYKTRFPHVVLTGDQNAKERFDTTAGGWSIATSVGGVGTGEHPDFVFVDDPITEAQSRSDAERNEANNWIDRTLSTRGVARNVRTLLIMQRLHVDDPSGHLLQQGGWEHICFPMRFEPFRPKTANDPGHTPDPRDQRTEAGQLLWPELFTDEKVKKIEIRLGPFAAAGQLQQRPAPEGGGLFKREWFKMLDAAPRGITRVCRGWDTAGTEDGGDWTCGVKIAEFGSGLFVVLDVVRVQASPANVDLIMLQTAQSDGPDCVQREEREAGASGKAVIASHTKLLVGFDHAEVLISGDKVTRAKPFRAQCEAGNVFIVRGAWNAEYLNELADFPVGQHDDQVDGSSSGFNALLLEPAKQEEWITW